jgi:proline iminopeptidase
VGNNPTIKVLLLHGGPGLTHELYECFDGYFPNESIEYIYYDQLGSYFSDQPNDNSLWTTERFVEEGTSPNCLRCRQFQFFMF